MLYDSWIEISLRRTLRDELTRSLAHWSPASTLGTLTGGIAKHRQVPLGPIILFAYARDDGVGELGVVGRELGGSGGFHPQ